MGDLTERGTLASRGIRLAGRGRRGKGAISEMGHVWTAPGWQELFSRFAALVGAAMCSAFLMRFT
jgi:hypothetical protein